MLVCWANERLKQVGWVGVTIPPLCPLSLHILFSAWLLFPLFLPQDTVNALSDFLRFFHFLFQCKIPLIEFFALQTVTQPPSANPLEHRPPMPPCGKFGHDLPHFKMPATSYGTSTTSCISWQSQIK